jgi:hypothetical protein
MHQPAVAYGRKDRGECEVRAEDTSAQVALRHGDGVARTKRYALKDATIFAKGDLVFGAAIEVIEHHTRETALCETPKVVNIDDSRRSYRTRCEGHRSPGLLMGNILSLRAN